ncbi:MAG: PAS domain S-box protein [Verrucomicrobia bacterium]|nr:PAS domain S-box protein [Verrucomicrobiota bacterium]
MAVYGYDADRRVIFWNRACVVLYGYEAEEALGRRLEDLIIPPAMRDGVVAAVRAWVDAGTAIPADELVLQRKNGEPVSVFSSHVMQRGIRGEQEMYSVNIELTELNRALAALAQSEANYHTLFEAIPHPLFVYDRETYRYLAVNRAGVERFGRPRDVLLQMTTQPPTGTYGPVEQVHRNRSGVPTLMEVSSHPVVWAERSARLVMAQDITARRTAERRLIEQARLLDQTTEAIVAVDVQGRITFWNRGAERLFGYPAGEMTGRQRDDLLPAGQMEGAVLLAQVLGPGDDDWRGEIRGVDRGGRSICIETSITIMRDDAGRPAGRISVSADISRRKALEAQIVQAQKMEVIGQLAGGVAHDFNSILMAMNLNLEMLAMDLRANAGATGMVCDLKTMIQRAAKLIEQLLLFARKRAMKMQIVDLQVALPGVTKMLHRLIGADITLVVTGPEGSLWVEADAIMLDQLVLNLAMNARDAMQPGGTLTIETALRELGAADVRAGAAPGDYACISVSDTGCGMAPEVLARAFEPFFTTKEVGKGTGLGLSTVHGIVHQHHGWVTVESTVGAGTTFRVFLPLSPPPESHVDEPAALTVRGGRETILLVEDDDVVRRLCSAMLLRLGYRVLACSDGPKAMLTWEQNRGSIDLLLADIVMPNGMSGLQLTERLRVLQPSLSVVLMSGYHNEIIKAEEISVKGIRFVSKPVDFATLAAVIRDCLDLTGMVDTAAIPVPADLDAARPEAEAVR